MAEEGEKGKRAICCEAHKQDSTGWQPQWRQMCRESQMLSGAVVQFQNWKAGWHETLEQKETCMKALV